MGEPAAHETRDDGPYLVLIALWQDTDDTDAIAEAVKNDLFPTPDGWPKGCIVAFRREVATGRGFLANLARFDLAGLRP